MIIIGNNLFTNSCLDMVLIDWPINVCEPIAAIIAHFSEKQNLTTERGVKF